MLSSPGRSPRRLSTPSPSASPYPLSDQKIDSNFSRASASGSDLTTVKRRRKSIVLDEDSYVAAIEKIIERDFFPDISKLRDRLDWLQAVRTQDPLLIREAQLKIIERRRLSKGGEAAAGASFRNASVTPGLSFLRNVSVTPSFSQQTDKSPRDVQFDGSGDGEEQVDASLSLDEFFRKYTSEDNDSFSRIIEKVNRKRKEKYGYLLESSESGANAGNNLIEGAAHREKCATDGYGTSYQPVHTLEGWKHTPKNLLMYHPADNGEVPLTEEEKALRLKGMTKEVVRSNTRFHVKALDADGPKDDESTILYAPVVGGTPLPVSRRDSDKVKKYDLEDLRKTPNRYYLESDKKADNGYSFVKTPSPAPGVDESPFITWGEIEGTPLRLEQEETPIDIGGSGDGPQFRIPLPPSRDVKAHSLSREAARKIRERSKMFHKPPLPSPVRGGSASPSTQILSHAGRKFIRKAIAKSPLSIDESLRASYRSASPGSIPPKTGRSMSRMGRHTSVSSRSPSVADGSDLAW